MKHIPYWFPRVLAVGFALFLAPFALDVFGEFNSIGETAAALFIHLIPTLILLAATALAWRWPWLGGVAFILLGVMSVFYFNTYRELMSFLVVSTPAFVVGVFFLWEGWRKHQIEHHVRQG